MTDLFTPKRTHSPFFQLAYRCIAMGAIYIALNLPSPTTATAQLSQQQITDQALSAFQWESSGFPWNSGIAQYLNGIPSATPPVPEYEASLLAWDETYIAMTQQAMFQATGDTQHLDILLDNAEQMYAYRGDRAVASDPSFPTREAVRPIGMNYVIVPAFISFNQGIPPAQRLRHAWLVHAAFPSHPITNAIATINQDPVLQTQYGTRTSALTTDIIETMDFFDPEFVAMPNGRGEYYEPYLDFYDMPVSGVETQGRMPYNMQNSAGLTYIALWKATGQQRFRDRAEALAKTFKNELTPIGDRYQWRYAPYNAANTVSDNAHAGSDVNFVIDAYEAGIVFNDIDIARLSNTMRHIQDGPGFTANLDGTGTGTLAGTEDVTPWVKLVHYDADLRSTMFPVFQTYWDASSSGKWPSLGTALFYESGESYTSESTFNDTFSGLQLSRRWKRLATESIHNNWDRYLSGSQLVIDNIDNTAGLTNQWIDLRRQRFVDQNTDWQVDATFSWDSNQGSPAPFQAMQRFYIELFDQNDILIAKVGIEDAWNTQSGGRIVILPGNSLIEPYGSIGINGSASIMIRSNISQNLLEVFWNSQPLLSVSGTHTLSRIDFTVGHFIAPGQAHFGVINIDSISLN